MTFYIGTPHTKNAGYYSSRKSGDSSHEQDDVQTCAHCQAVLLIREWKEEGGFCHREMKPLCLQCADRALLFGCEPFLKKLEAMMRKQMRFDPIATRVPPIPAPQSIIIGK